MIKASKVNLNGRLYIELMGFWVAARKSPPDFSSAWAEPATEISAKLTQPKAAVRQYRGNPFMTCPPQGTDLDAGVGRARPTPDDIDELLYRLVEKTQRSRRPERRAIAWSSTRFGHGRVAGLCHGRFRS